MGKGKRDKQKRREHRAAAGTVLEGGYEVRRLTAGEERARLAATALLRDQGMISSPGDMYSPSGENSRVSIDLLREAGVSQANRGVPVMIAALLDDEVAGAAVTHLKLEHAINLGMPLGVMAESTCLVNMAVHPDHRGKGLGSALVECATKEAQRDGFRRIFGFSEGEEDRGRRRAMYEKHGFTTGPQGSPPPAPKEVYGADAARMRGTRSGFYFLQEF